MMLSLVETQIVILFPADSLERHEVERDYRTEWEAARRAGFATALFDFDGLRRGENIDSVLRQIPVSDLPQTLIYRGWMLRADEYTHLFHALTARNWNMINDSSMYGFAHHAPENYKFWREFLPETSWIERAKFERNGVDFAPIFETLRPFGSSPVIVKDWVKSQKHKWSEACFIPNARDESEVRRGVGRFLELQSDFLTGGLVFRHFEKLRQGEWRSFWLDGELLSLSPNPSGDEKPDLSAVQELAPKCPCRFWTLDFAQKETGEWMAIEMGDGGVSGLPSLRDADEFYAALARIYPSRVTCTSE